MLPPGHLAGGYLATIAVLRSFGVPLEGNAGLVAFGLFCSIAPDFDFVFAFVKTRSLTIDPVRANHRKYYTHRPLVWLALAVPIMLNGGDQLRIWAALLLVGSWTHFLLDSIQYGVMWLWPFSDRLIAWRDVGKDFLIPDRRFAAFWKSFLAAYLREFRLTAIVEGVLIGVAIVVFILSP